MNQHWEILSAARPPIAARPRRSQEEALSNLRRRLVNLDAAILRSEAMAGSWAAMGAGNWESACLEKARLYAGQAETVRQQLKELESCQ